MNGSGSFVIAWSSKDQDGDNWGIFAKRYNASGVVQGGEFRVNTTTAKEQTNASVAIDDAGNFSPLYFSCAREAARASPPVSEAPCNPLAAPAR